MSMKLLHTIDLATTGEKKNREWVFNHTHPFEMWDRNILITLLFICPVVFASEDEIPAWEIALAAGSGAMAIILCVLAVMSFRGNRVLTVRLQTDNKASLPVCSKTTPPPPKAPLPPPLVPGRPGPPPPRGPPPRGPPPRGPTEDTTSTSKGGVVATLGNIAGQTVSGVKGMGAYSVAKAKETTAKIGAALRENPEEPNPNEQVKATASGRASNLNAKGRALPPVPSKPPPPKGLPPTVLRGRTGVAATSRV